MDVNSFLKRSVKTATVSAEPDKTVTEGENRAGGREGFDSPGTAGATSYQVATPAPSATVYSDTTPSGIRVTYTPGDGTKENPRQYTVNDVVVASVTTILDVLKKDMNWWAQRIGVEGVIELVRRGKATTQIVWDEDDKEVIAATADELVDLLTQEKISVNHVRDKASDRGTSVHKALEQWAQSGGEFAPTPQNFPEEERGWVEAILNFIDDCDGAAKPIHTELMVGSVEHGFAGRCDLVIELWEEREFVKRANPSRPTKFKVAPGRYMVDLKTKNKQPKEAYTRDMKQMAGYELAAIEGGYEPTDGQFVLYAMPNGTYELAESHAKAEDFLSALAVWKSDDAMKRRKKESK